MNDEIDGKSLDLKAQRLAQLQEIFPEFFSEGRLDLSAVKEVLGDDELATPDRYELSWAGKADARREIQRQTTATLIPDIDGSIDFDSAENVFIEGENLEVLRILQKAYFGKVKMIYIDPPYNTGGDSFVYPDDFKERLEDYEKRTGRKDDDGFLNKLDLFKKNSRENGQYHSVWMSMMYPRLYLARNLLREDGVIFISIDDNEQANLKLLCDEIFGSENFVCQFVWKKRTGSNDAKAFYVSSDHEYILAYAKSQSFLFAGVKKTLSSYSNPDNDPRGDWARDNLTCNKTAEERPNLFYPITDPKTGITYQANPNRVWSYEQERMKRVIAEGKVLFPKDGKGTPMYKRHLAELRSERKPLSSWVKPISENGNGNGNDDESLNLKFPINSVATKELREILGGQFFDYPKSTKMLVELISQATSYDDDEQIVMDFFAGAGVTGHGVLESNIQDGGTRKFVLVQMPEPTDTDSAARKAGYSSIADICKARLRNVIATVNASENAITTGLRSYKLQYSNFKKWNPLVADAPALLKQIEIFKEPLANQPDNSLDLLTELLLKSGVPLSAAIERLITSDGKPYYRIDGHSIYALDELSDELLKVIEESKPTMFVTLGNLFTGERADETMTNWKLQLQESGIEFKLI